MVCCVIPCFKNIYTNPGHISTKTLVITEIIRWICIILPLFLTIWQYMDIRGYPVFVEDMDITLQFWLIITGIIMGISLVVYLPLRILFNWIKKKIGRFRDGSWRPSIITYIFLCALPCLTLILVAVKTPPGNAETRMDPVTITVLQVTVMGLTVTEWVAKIKEEVLTFDLVGALAMDFFFAYDVIAFIMLSTYETKIYHSNWVYVCFVFAFVAMFKYVPTQPVSLLDRGGSKGHVTCILVSLFCSDIPFLVIRLTTMIIYGFMVSDLIFPVKNIALICFQCTQLYIIYLNKGKSLRHRLTEELAVHEKRELRQKLCACPPDTTGSEALQDVTILNITDPEKQEQDGKQVSLEKF